MQPSRNGPYTHWTHIDYAKRIWWEFVPVQHKPPQLIPPLVFEGHWQRVGVDSVPNRSFARMIGQSWLRRLVWLAWLPVLIAVLATTLLWVGYTEILFPGNDDTE